MATSFILLDVLRAWSNESCDLFSRTSAYTFVAATATALIFPRASRPESSV